MEKSAVFLGKNKKRNKLNVKTFLPIDLILHYSGRFVREVSIFLKHDNAIFESNRLSEIFLQLITSEQLLSELQEMMLLGKEKN